jgi:hypothetical protein
MEKAMTNEAIFSPPTARYLRALRDRRCLYVSWKRYEIHTEEEISRARRSLGAILTAHAACVERSRQIQQIDPAYHGIFTAEDRAGDGVSGSPTSNLDPQEVRRLADEIFADRLSEDTFARLEFVLSDMEQEAFARIDTIGAP